MDSKQLYTEICHSVMGRNVSRNSVGMQGRMWTEHSSRVGIPMPSTNDVRNWSVEDVGRYVDKIAEAHFPIPESKQRSLSECCIKEVINQFIRIVV